MKENNNKEEEKKQNLEEILIEKPSYKIFLNNPQLNIFYLTVLSMLIIPIIIFIISRNIFKLFGYSEIKQDTYSMICSITIIWIILIFFIIIYCFDDFKKYIKDKINIEDKNKEKKE